MAVETMIRADRLAVVSKILPSIQQPVAPGSLTDLTETMANESSSNERPSAPEVAKLLAALYGQAFGGKRLGKYRISRKFLRELARRQRITPDFVQELGDELFERGYVIADLETFFAVLDQRLFNSHRRVNATAIATLLDPESDVSRAQARPSAQNPSQQSRGEGEGRGNANGRG